MGRNEHEELVSCILTACELARAHGASQLTFAAGGGLWSIEASTGDAQCDEVAFSVRAPGGALVTNLADLKHRFERQQTAPVTASRRSSGRQRYSPLAFWEGERVVYNNAGGGEGPTVAGILLRGSQENACRERS